MMTSLKMNMKRLENFRRMLSVDMDTRNNVNLQTTAAVDTGGLTWFEFADGPATD